MSNDYEEPRESPRDTALMNKETRKRERLVAKTRAFKSEMKKALSAAISGDEQKAAIARDMIDAKNHPERRKEMKDQMWGGVGDDITGIGDIPDSLRQYYDEDELI